MLYPLVPARNTVALTLFCLVPGTEPCFAWFPPQVPRDLHAGRSLPRLDRGDRQEEHAALQLRSRTPRPRGHPRGQPTTRQGHDMQDEVTPQGHHGSSVQTCTLGVPRDDPHTPLQSLSSVCQGRLTLAVFTLVTRGRFLTSASKFKIAPNDGIFDISPENDLVSPNVKPLLGASRVAFPVRVSGARQ